MTLAAPPNQARRRQTFACRRTAKERISRAQERGAQVERQLEVLHAVRAYLAERGASRPTGM